MNNTYLYTRMLAEDVQTAELQMVYSKNHKRQHRITKPLFNKKEALAEKIYQEMEARKAGLGLHGQKKTRVPQMA